MHIYIVSWEQKLQKQSLLLSKSFHNSTLNPAEIQPEKCSEVGVAEFEELRNIRGDAFLSNDLSYGLSQFQCLLDSVNITNFALTKVVHISSPDTKGAQSERIQQ